MDTLPQDPYMLLSVVNMKLRDQYPTLAALSDDLGVDPSDIESRLNAVGFSYDPEHNCFS